TQLLLTKQSLPGLALGFVPSERPARTSRERNLPGVGRGQASPDEALPHGRLCFVTRLGVAEEEHVAQLDGPAAIVLGELILIELRERGRESLLHLAGERHATVLPVDGDELGEFVGTLDDAGERLRNRRAVRLVARHLANKQKRRMTQLHLL